MNYDTQYAFSHGLASTPQFQTLQQRQHQFQQHQQVFQQHQQFGQIAPTSNVFFQLTGGNNSVFQHKDFHQMALPAGGVQQPPLGTQHGMVASSFVKQGVPVRMEGNCVHLVGGPEGMLYQQQPQPDLKIITANPDARMLQQHSQLDAGLGLPQNAAATLLGIDMMRGQPQHLLDQGALDMGQTRHQQHQGIAMPGQPGILSYGKQQQFSGPWLQQQQQVNSSAGNLQQHQPTQSALPSFTHLWSQFQQQKNQTVVGVQPQQQAHVNTFQQPQQFHNQNQLQQSQQHPQMLSNPHQSPFAVASSFQTVANMQMINMPHFQDQSQQQSPLPVQPNQISCFSPCGPSNTPSPCSVERVVPISDIVLPNASLTARSSTSDSQPPLSDTSISPQHHTPSLLTDSSSIPPKVTVILDSLPHCETFPPTTHFQGNANAALKLSTSPVISCVDSPAFRNKPRVATSNNQHHFHQKKQTAPRPLKAISSTGSSMERSSSESSNFSSPPYTFTPPSSNDSLFSPGMPAFNPDELMLPDCLPEVPSAALSSLTAPSTLSPSSLSSSRQIASTVLPMTSDSNSVVKTDKEKSSHRHATVAYTSNNPLSTVATVLSLSSPSTTTVITAMASSHQLVTTTTTTTSVTLASHCLIDGAATSMGLSSNHDPKSHSKPSKTASILKSGDANPSLPKHQASNAISSNVEKKIKVPFSWHRQLDNGAIVYLSPSGTALQSIDQICQYLLSDSTCKCGLECPIQVQEFFSFDPSVASQAWTPDAEANQDPAEASRDGRGEKQQKQEDLRKLCNHRREVLALAALHSSQSQIATETVSCSGKKRDRKKSLSGGEGLILSPLKRLKTSITNAVNRHAVSTGKKKSLTQAMPDIPDNNQGSPHSFHKQQGLSFEDNIVPEKDHSVMCIDGTAAKQVLTEDDKCEEEIEKEKIDMLAPGSEDTILLGENFKSSRSAATKVQSLSNSPELQILSSEHYSKVTERHPKQGVSLKNATLPESHNSHLEMANSRELLPQVSHFDNPLSSAKVPGLTPSSPHFETSSTAQSVFDGKCFPKHSTPISQRENFSSWPDPSQLSQRPSASKPKRPKNKKEKQRTPSASTTASETPMLPSSTVSFLENPTVFVAQQTVMINNSIASCNIAYSSPGPTTPSSNSTCSMTKLNKLTTESKDSSSRKQEFTTKEEEEERKNGTDTDSNRSFSDTTENNDSAYLSQTGSDQERSDTIDGSDACLDSSKALDIYDFNCSEEKESKLDCSIVHVNIKGPDTTDLTKTSKVSQEVRTTLDSKTLSPHGAPALVKDAVVSEKQPFLKTKPKPRALPSTTKKEMQLKNGGEDPSSGDNIGSLNKDLSNLLASDNWNIPAVQQVLAQYSGGDPGQLNAAIQQVLAQASTAGLAFPASNLLTAAAKVQSKAGSKKSPNGISAFTSVAPPTCINNNGEAVSKLQAVESIVSPKSCRSSNLSVKASQHKEVPSVSPKSGVMKNAVQLCQGMPGGPSVNTKVPVSSQAVVGSGNSSASTTNDSKGKATPNMQTPGCHLVDTVSKIGCPITPAVPSSSRGNAMILNGFGTPRMVVNSQMPPVSVSMVTSSVSKPLSQVTIGLNQAVFGTASGPAPGPTSHLAQSPLLAPAQQQSPGGACIINASHPQMVKTSGNIGQAGSTQQLVAPSAHPPAQLAATQQASTQIMNTLSVQGLNPSQQLLLQQMSPCNPISQLSPAMAAQILTQNQQQQQLQQVSPSFLAGSQLQKLPQGPVLGNQTSIFASVPLPSFSAAPATSNCSGLFTQSNILASQQQQQQRSGDAGIAGILTASVDGTDHLAHSLSQVKDVAAAAAVSLANASMFAAATSQPVFVIPPANTNPVVQVLGSNPSLAPAPDLNVQQQSGNSFTAQLFGQQQQQQQSQQATAIDASQLPNLLSAGFNPLALQQTINTVNLGGVHQQQQLQMLQLQQLMLQQLQNQQGQSLQGISIPGPQAAPQTIVNAVVPTQNLQLSSMVDVNAIHPSLSPVAAAATPQNLLSNHLSPAQLHITSTIGTPTVVPGGSLTVSSVLQNAGVQKMSQASVKTIASGASQTQVPALTSPPEKCPVNSAPAVQENCPQKHVTSTGPQPPPPQSGPQPPATPNKAAAVSLSPAPSTLNPTSPASSATKPATTGSKSSKSKSKSKKSETKKSSDPESERNEEDIAATVQQILAQAVQQQRELNLAAKNQPPPPPKSKSKKSQSRSRANANQGATAAAVATANKEHDLGKLPSIISDDVVIHKPEQAVLSGSHCSSNSACAAPVSAPSTLLQPSMSAPGYNALQQHSGTGMIKQSQLLQQPPPPSPHHPVQSSVVSPAARTAQSSQSVETPPLVISSPPQHIIYQAGSIAGQQVLPPALQKNGAVISDSVQVNCKAEVAGETVITNSNLVGNSNATCGSGKKSTISLKDHLSSIISKDKDNSKKKVNESPRASRAKDAEDAKKTTHVISSSSLQSTGKVEPVTSSKVLRKSLK